MELARPMARVVQSAIEQTTYTRFYDPAYVRLAYPGGDVPRERGVCTDVVIRAFRAAGVDLQQEVHRDMAANFSAYPQRWGLRRPDRNIDHRRVPNLMAYFTRQRKSLSLSTEPSRFRPGDVVAWDLAGECCTLELSPTSGLVAVSGIKWCTTSAPGPSWRMCCSPGA